jgi:hypothetical protein
MNKISKALSDATEAPTWQTSLALPWILHPISRLRPDYVAFCANAERARGCDAVE